MTSLQVLVTTTSRLDDLTATQRSLEQQTDVACTMVVGADVAALRRALDEGGARYITVVRAGTVLFPGALRTLHTVLSGDPDIEMADAFALETDAQGWVSREAARDHAATLHRRLSPEDGEIQALTARRGLTLALPTFRCEALRGSDLPSGVALDDAIRRAAVAIVARGNARLVRQFLCAQPLAQGRPRRPWRSVRHRAKTVVRAARTARMWGRFLRWPRPYEVLSALVRHAPAGGLRGPRHRPPPAAGERIAYVLWRYPTRSETFIRREVQALRAAGVALEVVALETADPPLAPDPASPAGAAIYFGPASSEAGRSAIRERLRRRPWTVLRLWSFVMGHRYGWRVKTWWRDRNLMYLAGQLASVLAAQRITHVHSPWANSYAIVAFVASRLLGVTFSVQARASEIHRSTEAKAVADRLRFAEFVVTNSHYNERHLRATLGPSSTPPIHVVYNGIELTRFRAAVDAERFPGPCRLLAVGRLVEQKGFRYLLLACALLRDRGLSFTCEIVGPPADPLDTVNWLELRMLLRERELESTVSFRGAQDLSNVLAAYQRADVFVLPCVRARDGAQDITPNSVIEAMAMGLPVVSTTSGAIPEIVDHGHNGLLVPPADVQALADALARLIGDAPLRRQLGAAARAKVEQRFDIDRNVRARVALFQSLGTREPDRVSSGVPIPTAEMTRAQRV